MEIKVWILSGTEQNWDIAFKENKWGAKKGLKNRWEQMSAGDILGFYVTSPVSGIIGFGKLTKKAKETIPYWPDEIRTKQAIWPFRFYFKVIYRLSYPDWRQKRLFIRDLKLSYQAGINRLSNKDVITSLFERTNLSWNKDLNKIAKVKRKKEKIGGKPAALHKDIQDKLFEIGQIRNRHPAKEHPMDGKRLDVIWRRISDGHPIWVFEIQIGGNVTGALGKLKHAWDNWNSKLYIVAEEKYRREIDGLLSGTFHEIQEVTKIITVEEIQSLYEAEKEAAKHKEVTGLI